MHNTNTIAFKQRGINDRRITPFKRVPNINKNTTMGKIDRTEAT